MSAKTADDSIYVYLNSSDSTDYFEDNTTTKFRNILAKPLALPYDEQWCVGLSSFCCSNLLVDDDQRFVKIASHIIAPVFNVERVFVVSTRKKADRTNNRQIYFEPINKEYYPVETSLLSQIDITLQDYKNHTLSLTFGQPTIVVLEF